MSYLATMFESTDIEVIYVKSMLSIVPVWPNTTIALLSPTLIFPLDRR